MTTDFSENTLVEQPAIALFGELGYTTANCYSENTVLMAMYGATIGQLAILGSESATNQACCGFWTTSSEYGYPFLFLQLLHRRRDIINLRVGAAQQNVSQDVIREIEMPKPPLPLVQEFNGIVEPFFEGVHRLQRKNANLRKTRDLLLPKLISGQVDVEDLGIETGEALTEEST